MTQQVPTNGFIVPPTPPAAGNGLAGLVPPVQNPAPVAAQPAAQESAAAPNGDAMAAAIAALTAALQSSTPSAQATAEVPAELTPAGTEAPDLNDVNVADLDDPILRSMAYAIKAGAPADLDMNRVLGLALDRGDPTLIDRAYLVEKCGKEAAHRIQIAEGIVAQVNAKAEAAAKTVYEAAGSQEQWGNCAAAFNTKAPAELRQVVVSMLDSGVEAQIKAASKLVVEFAKGQGFVPNSNPLLNAGAAPSTGQALSKSEFQAELRKLNPESRDFQEQRNALFSRRSLGRKLNK